MKMKRALVLFLILTAVQTAGNAEKARFLSEDGDKAYHSRHLEMHTGEETCRVCGNYLKVRRKPSGDSAVDGHAEQADLVQLLEIRGSWARIRVLYSAETSPDSAAGLEGWIDAAYLECACSERTYYAGGTDPVTGGSITAGGVNLRETPASGSRSLGKLARGQRVTVLGRYASGGKTMFRVVCKNGQNGFVSADYLDVGGEPPVPDYLRKARAAAGTDAGVAGEAGAAYARAATERLRVRETPGGEIIGHISPADVLARYETKGKWTRISVVQAKSGYEDCLAGLSGWVSTEYLEALNEAPLEGKDAEPGAFSDWEQVLDAYYNSLVRRENGDFDGVIACEPYLISLGQAGYVFRDLDGDGEEELLVFDDDRDLIALYTRKNRQICHVFDGWERNRYTLLRDGTVYNTGSNGAGNSIEVILRLSGVRMQVVQAVYDQEENIYYTEKQSAYEAWADYDRDQISLGARRITDSEYRKISRAISSAAPAALNDMRYFRDYR